jgi:hypothetical protein
MQHSSAAAWWVPGGTLETHRHIHSFSALVFSVVLNCNESVNRQTSCRTGSLSKAATCCPLCKLTYGCVLCGCCCQARVLAANRKPLYCTLRTRKRCAVLDSAGQLKRVHHILNECVVDRWAGGFAGVQRCRGGLVTGGPAQCRLSLRLATGNSFPSLHGTALLYATLCVLTCFCTRCAASNLASSCCCAVVLLQRCLPLLCVP